MGAGSEKHLAAHLSVCSPVPMATYCWKSTIIMIILVHLLSLQLQVNVCNDARCVLLSAAQAFEKDVK